MTGKVIIGSTDITGLVVDGSYNMDNEGRYASWEDGNYVEHRSGRRNKLKGSFDVCLCEKTGMTLSQLNTLIEGLTHPNGTVTSAFYATNTGSVKAVNAFIHLKNSECILTKSGFINVVTVEVQEA